MILTITGILVTVALWLYGCFQFVQFFPGSCSIGDWSKTTSAIVLAAAASSGWLILICIGLYGSGFLKSRRSFQRAGVFSDTVGSRLTSSTTVRLFCSQSASYRGFIHNQVGLLKRGMTIKVLMRTDSTPARQDDLKRVAEKWHTDIAGRGVTVEVRAVEWSPLMFRGWVFDERAAVLGWYNRANGRTLGQGEDTFLIEDKGMVKGLVDTFDAVFQGGTQL